MDFAKSAGYRVKVKPIRYLDLARELQKAGDVQEDDSNINHSLEPSNCP